MKVFVCALLFTSFVHSKFMKSSDVLIDIGENGAKIVKIFEKVSTLNVLLKNFEQPEGIVQLLESIFDIGMQTFVIFNFGSEENYDDWIEHCATYRRESSWRIIYHERFYKKTHNSLSPKKDLHYFDDFEPNSSFFPENNFDPQSPAATSNDGLPESFAETLDKWYTFRTSGFIIFCPFEAFELFLGCLVNRSGTFLFIIEKDSEMGNQFEDVAGILKRAWMATTNLKLFVLIFEELYVVNPFEIDGKTKSFGVLEKLSDEGQKQDFKHLNKYPMYVELFESAYSIPNETFSGKLKSFFGPDVEVARFIEEQMNVSSN